MFKSSRCKVNWNSRYFLTALEIFLEGMVYCVYMYTCTAGVINPFVPVIDLLCYTTPQVGVSSMNTWLLGCTNPQLLRTGQRKCWTSNPMGFVDGIIPRFSPWNESLVYSQTSLCQLPYSGKIIVSANFHIINQNTLRRVPTHERMTTHVRAPTLALVSCIGSVGGTLSALAFHTQQGVIFRVHEMFL